ncbi:hypothetical protein ACQRXC_14905 [Niallia taxi]|uniref:hypothetical protein n=1 Tax=Niallia taxi TaxID=2499688 RepID=UPI003F61E0B0
MSRIKKETSEDIQLRKQQETVESLQKKFVVVHDFKDLKDNNKLYFKGDSFPKQVTGNIDEERIKALSSTKNKMNRVLITEQV